jgi:hypothetical protein
MLKYILKFKIHYSILDIKYSSNLRYALCAMRYALRPPLLRVMQNIGHCTISPLKRDPCRTQDQYYFITNKSKITECIKHNLSV